MSQTTLGQYSSCWSNWAHTELFQSKLRSGASRTDSNDPEKYNIHLIHLIRCNLHLDECKCKQALVILTSLQSFMTWTTSLSSGIKVLNAFLVIGTVVNGIFPGGNSQIGVVGISLVILKLQSSQSPPPPSCVGVCHRCFSLAATLCKRQSDWPTLKYCQQHL